MGHYPQSLVYRHSGRQYGRIACHRHRRAWFNIVSRSLYLGSHIRLPVAPAVFVIWSDRLAVVAQRSSSRWPVAATSVAVFSLALVIAIVLACTVAFAPGGGVGGATFDRLKRIRCHFSLIGFVVSISAPLPDSWRSAMNALRRARKGRHCSRCCGARRNSAVEFLTTAITVPTGFAVGCSLRASGGVVTLAGCGLWRNTPACCRYCRTPRLPACRTRCRDRHRPDRCAVSSSGLSGVAGSRVVVCCIPAARSIA